MPALLRLWLAGLVLALLTVLPQAPPAAASEDFKSVRVVFPVTVNGTPQEVVGYLYYHGSPQNRPLVVLLHGGSYDHRYWDAPVIGGVDYSFAHYLTRAKYAVLALDQLGAGESSHPQGDSVTLAAVSESVHQILTTLRTAANPTGVAFPHIALGSHSFGALVATRVLADHPGDADALFTTGAGHTPTYPPQVLIDSIGPLLATDYAAMPPAVREAVFYYAPAADPAVIAFDNSTLANPLARGFLLDLLAAEFNPALNGVGQVQGPVLVQLGDFDSLCPAVPAAQERAYWTSSTQVTVQRLDEMGHDVNLHRTHLQSWTGIETWLDSVLP